MYTNEEKYRRYFDAELPNGAIDCRYFVESEDAVPTTPYLAQS